MATRLTHLKRQGRPCRNCGGTERYGRSYSCVRCTNMRSSIRKALPAYKAQAKRYGMKRRYGLSPEDAVAMLSSQGGACACCSAAEPGNGNGWVIDHDHATGTIRGVLCHGCNVGLGAFKDSEDRLRSAIAYLQMWSVLAAKLAGA